MSLLYPVFLESDDVNFWEALLLPIMLEEDLLFSDSKVMFFLSEGKSPDLFSSSCPLDGTSTNLVGPHPLAC